MLGSVAPVLQGCRLHPQALLWVTDGARSSTDPGLSPEKPFPRLLREEKIGVAAYRDQILLCPATQPWCGPLLPPRPLSFLLPQAAPATGCDQVLGTASLLGPSCT